MVLISTVLRLISRYRGSYLKDASCGPIESEWPSGLYSLRQVTEVKLGRARSDFGWVTTEA